MPAKLAEESAQASAPASPQELAGNLRALTDARILEISRDHQQYPGSKEVTLRGTAIVDVVLACLAEKLAQVAAQHKPPGTHGSPANPKWPTGTEPVKLTRAGFIDE